MSGKQFGIEHTSRTFHVTYADDALVAQFIADSGLRPGEWFADLIHGAAAIAAAHEQRTQQRLAEVEAEHRRREQEQQPTYPCLECKQPVYPGAASLQFLAKHGGHPDCFAARRQDREWGRLTNRPRGEDYLTATARLFGDGTKDAEDHIEPLARLAWSLGMEMVDVARVLHEFKGVDRATRELVRRLKQNNPTH